jgi:hypothetical protein
LEQNRLIARTTEVLEAMLQSIPGSLYLRYLTRTPLMNHLDGIEPDEIGYLFYPKQYGFCVNNFLRIFPGKSRKKLIGEIEKIKAHRLSFRFNHLSDIEALFQLNVNVFNTSSYFYDDRFHQSFEKLATFLWDANMLRITTILIGGKIAAVDMGAIFNRTYTLLAGGTNPEFPGIAKVINLHHLEWSCQQRFDTVDFLCGDFNWKQRFRLTPRPLVALKHQPSMPLYAQHRFHENANVWS